VSTIAVTARGVKTVHDALEEVDAVVEALKDRADEVLKMLGKELERDDEGHGLTGPAIKAAATGVATKATTSVAKSAATKVAKKAAKQARKKAKGARKQAKKAAKRAAKKAVKTAAVVEVARNVAERAPDTLHVGKHRRSKRRPAPPLVIVVLGAAAIGGVVMWRMRSARLRELRAVENTPDEFGVILEREQLAGVVPPR
jgi:hypothetical protein